MNVYILQVMSILRQAYCSPKYLYFLLPGQETLLVKERLDLPSNLRELDEDVEKVELSLRKSVAAGLDGDPAALPPHVLQKVDERLQRAAKKNAALDMDYYQSVPLFALLNLFVIPAKRSASRDP